jgi:hypothetical protein
MMNARAATVAALAAGALLLHGGADLYAGRSTLPTVTLTVPGGAALFSVTPEVAIETFAVMPADRPLAISLQVASTPDFTPPLLLDSAILAENAIVRFPRPLPSGAPVYMRALARTAAGDTARAETGPHEVPQWVTLLAPNSPTGTTLQSRRPEFTWSGAHVEAPPGPWNYTFRITERASGNLFFITQTTDTALTLPVSLDLNTSYRWSVTAKAGADSVRVESFSSIVVVDADRPLATLLYQNFPNPFPSESSAETCIWFDLHEPSAVTLTIADIRGNHVRTLVPGPDFETIVAAGRYGRVTGGSPGGCSGSVRWDGRDDGGRRVVAGIYLIRLRAAGVNSYKKIIFRGP